MKKENFLKPEYDPDMNPVDYVNYNMSWDEVMKQLSKVKKLTDTEYFCPKNQNETRKTADFSVNGDGRIRVNHENGYNLPIGKKYTKFALYTRVRHRGNYKAAIAEIEHERLGKHIPYIRVGCDYFKVFEKSDRYGIAGVQLKGWKKEEIKQDHGKESMHHVKTYDDFIIIPDNKNKLPVSEGNFNLYNPFRHKPKKGSIYWSEVTMKQIFGDQINLGYRYMKLLYQHPKRYGPILVLVSRERSTGKSTFINWLNMIFGANMVIITSSELESSFNHIYATANIITVEETFIEKKHIVEKLKALSTQKEIVVNQKFVSNYKIPFHGKFILTSNNEDKFAIIDEDEIRFWVRKLEKPTEINFNIEDELLKEIPAFLHHIENNVPEIDFNTSRTGFTKEEITNDNLKNVVDESRTSLYKDMRICIGEYIDNLPENIDKFYATPKDLKNKFFEYNANYSHNYIMKVLKDEFRMKPEKESGVVIKYKSVFLDHENNIYKIKTGNPYCFTREMWGGMLEKTDDEQTQTTDNQINEEQYKQNEECPF